ncbi:PAS domain-containing sensor histidine kinase [Rhodopirellula sallentina]|uniref:histidine kinase n=1 Tax=Rhodopirellula sallentina SM41 TaxID=1263870 RepID=M5U2K0_9BACT|nr:HAMP domain-containing sensor histidine kinase [Rhodopirellula sallentina]EMI55687.1 PAS/PAC sensor Signal transduction histidine kinase [Rhodopirellula sallentina SM41]
MLTENLNWQEITNQLSHSVFLILEDASFLYANQHACEKLKYSPEEMSKMKVFDITPRYQLVSWQDTWEKFKTHKRTQHESTHRDSEGNEFPILVNVTYNDDAADQPFLIVHTYDLTQSQRDRQQLLLAIKAAKVGFWDYDLESGNVYVSPELYHQVGMQVGEKWDVDVWTGILHPEDHDQAVACLEEFQSGRDEEYLNVYRLKHSDGGYRWFESRGQFVTDTTGKHIRMVGTQVDITTQKSTEEEVRKMLQKSEAVSQSLARSNRDLEQFAYVASHDLRAPLRGLIHLTSWVREDAADANIELPDNVLEHLRKMHDQVERMDALLSGLLEYSRVGNRNHMQRSVRLQDILKDSVELSDVPETFEIVLPEKDITWVTVREPLQRVFQNLIDNAVKHHDRDQGKIAITCQETASDYVFSVIDDGPGIDDKHHGKVFEIFQKLHPSAGDEGAGLGLTIVQKLVQTAGGQIEIHNASPRGTEFRFTWPKEITEEALN